MRAFPADFIWGAASSAYQIEGYPTADGGGLSIWDTFSHTPGKIAWNDNGDLACDSYHRYDEDLALLKELGVSAYRFSVSWARVDPRGDGHWNEAGVAYYDRLVDLCRASGLEPVVTLYHWELPQAVEDRGGWLTPHTAYAFARYAAMISKRFRGRVKLYFTLNEPQCTVALGYGNGTYAPGKKLDMAGCFRVLVNQQLAHGLAQRAIKSVSPDAVVGLASTGRLCYPVSESEEDISAARKASFAVDVDDWMFTHNWLLDPICLGSWPDCTGTALEPLAETVTDEEMRIIRTAPDMLGYNIYNGHAVRAAREGFTYVPKYPGFPRTALKWPVTPEVLDYGVRFLCERYALPCCITENGLSCSDIVSLDGQVHDPNRIDFLSRYLTALRKAIDHGADVRGYFHWALTDNFEWSNGFAERFGLVYIDFPTGRRIKKDSFYWLKKEIGRNTLPE